MGSPSPTSGPRSRQGAVRGRRPKPRPAPYHLPMPRPRIPAMKRSFPLNGKTRSTPEVMQAKFEPTALNSVSLEPAGNPRPPPSPRIVTPRESDSASTPDCTETAIPCPTYTQHRITSHLRALDPKRYRIIPLDDLEREDVRGRGNLSTSITIDPTFDSTTNTHPCPLTGARPTETSGHNRSWDPTSLPGKHRTSFEVEEAGHPTESSAFPAKSDPTARLSDQDRKARSISRETDPTSDPTSGPSNGGHTEAVVAPKTSKRSKNRSRSRKKDKYKAQYQPLTKPASESDFDDLEDIPPVLSMPVTTPTEALNKKFSNTLLKNFVIMSLLIFACSVPLTEAVKINGALLCRPRVSADNINDFISALGDAFNTVLQSELGHPQEIAKNGPLSVILIPPQRGEKSNDLRTNCDQLGSLYSPESATELIDLQTILADVYRTNILMATVEFGEIIKPFSLKFTIVNIKGDINAQNRKKNYITFRAPDQSPNPPDMLEAHHLTTAMDHFKSLQGLLCSVDPSKNKPLKRDFSLLQDRTQSFAVALDNQIEKFINMGDKLGLIFNETEKRFVNKIGVRQCISTFVDLVPTKTAVNLKNKVEELLQDKLLIHTDNVKQALQLMGTVGKELSKLDASTEQIAQGDYDVIEITNDFDTIIEALRNLDIRDPLTQFLIALGLSILLATLCFCVILTCLCQKVRQRVVNRLVDSYRL